MFLGAGKASGEESVHGPPTTGRMEAPRCVSSFRKPTILETVLWKSVQDTGGLPKVEQNSPTSPFRNRFLANH